MDLNEIWYRLHLWPYTRANCFMYEVTRLANDFDQVTVNIRVISPLQACWGAISLLAFGLSVSQSVCPTITL